MRVHPQSRTRGDVIQDANDGTVGFSRIINGPNGPIELGGSSVRLVTREAFSRHAHSEVRETLTVPHVRKYVVFPDMFGPVTRTKRCAWPRRNGFLAPSIMSGRDTHVPSICVGPSRTSDTMNPYLLVAVAKDKNYWLIRGFMLGPGVTCLNDFRGCAGSSPCFIVPSTQ